MNQKPETRNQKPTCFSWSSGKDAALALYLLLQDQAYSADKLITTVNSHHDRVSMHGLRRELLEQQVKSIGLPLETIELPTEPSMEIYEERINQLYGKLSDEGFQHIGFGDIFLQDLKEYRDRQMESFGITGVYPIWKRDSRELIHEFIDLGFKAKIICLNATLLDESFLGRDIDLELLKDLPSNVDPCGENGEFHTFCYDGPIFSYPVLNELGEKVYREYKSPSENEKGMGFWFCDLNLTK